MRTILKNQVAQNQNPLEEELGWAKLSSRRRLQTGIKTYKIIITNVSSGHLYDQQKWKWQK